MDVRKWLVFSTIMLALMAGFLGCARAQAAPEHLESEVCSGAALIDTTGLAPLGDSLRITATHPTHQALNVPLSSPVTATFSMDVNASTVSTTTFAVQAMQSGLITGTLAYDALARTLTLTPTRSFHAGEVVRPTATHGILSAEGVALQPYQWQFTAGQVNPIAPCGFVDIDAGLTGVSHSSVAWGDYDTDGRLDILLTGRTTSGAAVSKIYHNAGGGLFAEIAAGLTGVAWGSAAWGDYDNDGRPDILLTGEEGFLGPVARVYHNNGDGTFTDISAGLTGVEFSSVAWGDYDNDGWFDILLTGYDPNNSVTELWRNQGNGTFTKVTTALPGVGEGAIAWGDYDNDGNLDLLLTGYDNDGYRISELWRNQGDSGFTQAVTLTGTSDSSVAWGDYNGDGWLDILLTGYGGDEAIPLAQVLRNNGDGSFSDIGAGLTGVGYSSVAWGDYDSDGDLDILLTGSDSDNTALTDIYRNDGASGFVRFGGAALTGVWYGSAAWGDFDGNGRLGILLAGQYAAYGQTSPLSRVYRSADECHADLKIVKRAEPPAAVPGATVTYTLDFSNLGSLTATGVSISDNVPADIINPTLLSHNGAIITSTGSAPNFAWQVEDLVAGLGGTIIITGTLARLDPNVVVTNRAEISSTLDANLSNNFPAAYITVLEVPHADLGITKRVTPAAVTPGSVVTYTLTYTNISGLTATGVSISDSVPISITDLVSASSGATITQTGSAPAFAWQVQDLAPGQGGMITLTGMLAVAPVDAVITNTAEITTPMEGAPADNLQAVALTVLAGPTPVTPVVQISRQITNVLLSWTDAPENFGGYSVWYSTRPNFLPGDSGVTLAPRPAGSVNYLHTDAASSGKTYYYRVQGVNGNGVSSALSNQVGSFSFALTPGAP